MADLYSQVIAGDGVSTYTVGGNTKRIFPTSEMGTPKMTPIVIDTEGETLPSGQTAWAENDGDSGNYVITSDYQTQGDVFLAVRAVQQFCTVFEVGVSSNGSSDLTILCRDSSIPYDDGDTFQDQGNVITKLQTAVRAALGGAEVIVRIGRIHNDDTD